MKSREKRRAAHTLSGPSTLRQGEFTEYVATKFPASAPIEGEHFTVPPEFKKDLFESLLILSNGKAAGPDETFNEALTHHIPANVDILFKLWAACCRTATTPTKWSDITLCPIHKTGTKTLASNYRPIALMSHARKAVEKAVDLNVRRQTSFALSQCGFKPRTGTENAIFRFIYAAKRKHNNIAVLDIKGAFSSVPRPRLLQRLRNRLQPNLAAMITHFLTPDRIRTLGDDDETCRTLSTGVPEGGAISPTLFNIYIDSLIHQIENAPESTSLYPAIVYADDIMLLA